MNKKRLAIPISPSERKFIKYGSNMYSLSQAAFFSKLLMYLNEDIPFRHPALLPDEKRPHIFMLPVTQEEYERISHRAKQLGRTRASFLRTLLSHLKEFTAADVWGQK